MFHRFFRRSFAVSKILSTPGSSVVKRPSLFVFGAAVALSSTCMFLSDSTSRHSYCIGNLMPDIKGNASSFQLPRTKLRNDLFKFFRSSSRSYGVIYGAVGCGKTTLVRRIIKSLDDEEGVLLFDIPKNVTGIRDGLKGILNENSLLEEHLQVRAAAHQSATHRPLVIVLDSVENLRPDQISILLKVVADAARQGSVRFVLVCDATAVRCLQASASLWALSDPVEVSELSELEAIEYLVQLLPGGGLDAAVAKEAVLTLTGGNLGLLNEFAADIVTLRSIEAVKSRWFDRLRGSTDSLGVGEYELGLKLLTDKKAITVREAGDYFSAADLNKLVDNHILSYHSGAKCLKFNDKRIERFFVEKFGKT